MNISFNRLTHDIKIAFKPIAYYIKSRINALVPKDKRLVFLVAKEPVRWNIFAICEYFEQNANFNYYKVVCYSPQTQRRSTRYVKIIKSSINAMFLRLRAKYVFSEIMSDMFSCKPANGQIVVQLWHGIALKKIGFDKKNEYLKTSYTHILSYSDFVSELLKKDWMISNTQNFIISQNPRDDWMFRNSDCWKYLQLPQRRKMVLWLPTFRNNCVNGFCDSYKDFPVLSKDNILDLDNFLVKRDILLLIKLHPLQNNIAFLSTVKCKNIKILSDASFLEGKFELYDLIGNADALLSDYSSVAIDYMLLDRPIGYVIDDIEEYGDMRGFHVPDPLILMPGHHIKNYDQLLLFFRDISEDKDKYRDERHEVSRLLNAYDDAKNCQRVLDAVGIKRQ